MTLLSTQFNAPQTPPRTLRSSSSEHLFRCHGASISIPRSINFDAAEHPEALESGTVHLVGTNHDLIVSEVSTLLDDAEAYGRMSKAVNPYGDGNACERIVHALYDDI